MHHCKRYRSPEADPYLSYCWKRRRSYSREHEGRLRYPSRREPPPRRSRSRSHDRLPYQLRYREHRDSDTYRCEEWSPSFGEDCYGSSCSRHRRQSRVRGPYRTRKHAHHCHKCHTRSCSSASSRSQQSSKRSRQSVEDDKEGHLVCRISDWLHERKGVAVLSWKAEVVLQGGIIASSTHSSKASQRQGDCGGFPQPCCHTEAPCVLEQSYMLQDSLEHMQLFDLMRRMLEFDPAQRITLAEALLHPFAGLTPEERSFHSSRNPSR